MAGLIIAMIAGALLLVALIAGALVAVVFIRKLQARNESLEGLALDNLSMGVDVSDNNVSANVVKNVPRLLRNIVHSRARLPLVRRKCTPRHSSPNVGMRLQSRVATRRFTPTVRA